MPALLESAFFPSRPLQRLEKATALILDVEEASGAPRLTTCDLFGSESRNGLLCGNNPANGSDPSGLGKEDPPKYQPNEAQTSGIVTVQRIFVTGTSTEWDSNAAAENAAAEAAAGNVNVSGLYAGLGGSGGGGRGDGGSGGGGTNIDPHLLARSFAPSAAAGANMQQFATFVERAAWVPAIAVALPVAGPLALNAAYSGGSLAMNAVYYAGWYGGAAATAAYQTSLAHPEYIVAVQHWGNAFTSPGWDYSSVAAFRGSFFNFSLNEYLVETQRPEIGP